MKGRHTTTGHQDPPHRTVEEAREMTIRAPYRTIAAMGGALLVMLLPGPEAAAAGEDTVQDTVQEPVLQGEEITGGSNPGDAVALSSGTQYLDEFTTGTLHYRIPREVAHSTLHVGITTLGQSGDGDQVRVEMGTWEGDLCASDTISSSASGFLDHLRTTHVAAGPPLDGGADGTCGSSEEIVLTIELNADPEDAVSVGQPLEILVYEEPRPVRLGELPPPDEGFDHDWRDIGRDVSGALEIEPGRSFGMAPELEPGSTYEVTIRPGETQIFRVPVDWGERLQAEAFFPEPDEHLADRLAGMGSVSLAVTNPLRALVDHDSGTLSTSSATQSRVSPGPVRWFNREFNYNMLAGDHYLVVTADEHDASDSLSLFYRLTLDTFGEAGDGAPAYPDDYEGAWPTFSGGEVTADGPGTGALTRISALGDSTAVVAVLAVVGLLLIGSGSIVLVRVIRDPRPLPDGAGPAPWQGPAPQGPTPQGQQVYGAGPYGQPPSSPSRYGQRPYDQRPPAGGAAPEQPSWGRGPEQH
ncbi:MULTISPECIES: hypothetical protein [Actinomycetes]|uniref:Peptidase n=2 Tax=Actinomycetes TaxID=1760 RepID=A0ABP6LZT9_9MICC